MKKNMVLCMCVLLILMVCLADNRLQKRPRAMSGSSVPVSGTAASESAVPVSGTEASESAAPVSGTEASGKAAAETQDERIRVLLRSDDFASEYHERAEVAVDGKTIVLTTESPEVADGKPFVITPKDGTFSLPQLKRAGGVPVYEGTLTVYGTPQGLLLVNELPLEQYLCAVVPSEMPSSYPEEALKAQAICARTYAEKQKQEGRAAEFYADVDDSVEYQVYNNQGRAEEADAAVAATEGMVMTKGGILIDALYYSTSCGVNLSLDLSSETVFAAYLTQNHLQAYEAQEPWFRWNTEIALSAWENVTQLAVRARGENGAADLLAVTRQTEEGETTEEIRGEYAIRKFLAEADPVIVLQDGREAPESELLPSAFFLLRPQYDEADRLTGYQVLGGGYGHGEGMSQNGAKHMALEGMDCFEILRSYYGDVQIAK